MKFFLCVNGLFVLRRSPCGERGLKSLWAEAFPACQATSLPVRGAWVEIAHPVTCPCALQSLPVRGAWVEMRRLFCITDAV